MERTDKSTIGDTLMQLMTRCREKAFCKYMKDDPEYKRLLKISCEADKNYSNMDLTPEQREQIDFLLNSRTDAGECELTLTYIAGIMDGITFLRHMGFLDMYVSEE
ncbi:MAG: hypothetical protein HFG47_06920 [Lachnospiraceae bacterium]|nr:hypothetical protein [Lachnospiraceae bacterium]